MRLLQAAALACCLTDDALFAPDANGLRPKDPAWSPDGRYLAYLWGQEERWDESPIRRSGSESSAPREGRRSG